MEAGPKTPVSVAFCIAMIRVAARLVPRAQRQAWTQEWTAEIWHRWQFFLHAGGWDGREAFRLFSNSAGAFADAAWHVISEETVRSRFRDCARSPWTCLGGLAALLFLLAIVSSGFPATRQLLAFPSQQKSGRLLFIWLHPVIGGADRGVPPEVVPAWAAHSHLLESVAGFNIVKTRVAVRQAAATKPLVIVTDPHLFDTLQARPVLGTIPRESGVAIDRRTWVSLFHADPKVIGSRIEIGAQSFPVMAVLPANFQFLTRRPAVYLIEHAIADKRVMVVARARLGTTKRNLDQELTRIAEDDCYYFFRGQLRLGFLDTSLFTPVVSFGSGVLASGLIAFALCGFRLRRLRLVLRAENRRSTARRASFFLAKLTLALAVLFIAGLEWSRSESSLLFGSRDPGSGPFLVWLYIAGAMAVFFWSVADQRARCRVCLRLLCFPVRIGCPGCLLLDWSGTELLCTQGHGVLHVPLLAPSWDQEAEHWIALDESWRGLFARSK